MNTREAAARLGVHERTIWRWIKTGQLRTTQVPVARGTWRHDITLEDLIDADDQRGVA